MPPRGQKPQYTSPVQGLHKEETKLQLLSAPKFWDVIFVFQLICAFFIIQDTFWGRNNEAWEDGGLLGSCTTLGATENTLDT